MVEYYIMKKWKLFISTLLFTGLLLVSCATTSNEAKANNEAIEIAEPQPTQEELFLNSLENVTLKFTAVPSKTKKGKAFSSAYEIVVTDKDGSPVPSYEITLVVPSAKEGSNIIFKELNVSTDENGHAEYMPDAPAFAAKTQISAYPAIPEGLAVTARDVKANTVYADFLCESDIVSKGAIMFVFEYNENGKSPKNSYDILSGLRSKGVYQIGNAPISDTDYINASKEKIYKENYAYVGTDFGYLIGGTVKFTNPVEKNDDGTYTAHMIAELYGIDMKTGNVIYEATNEYTSSGTNWNKAVESCRDKLTAMVVDSIMFGL